MTLFILSIICILTYTTIQHIKNQDSIKNLIKPTCLESIVIPLKKYNQTHIHLIYTHNSIVTMANLPFRDSFENSIQKTQDLTIEICNTYNIHNTIIGIIKKQKNNPRTKPPTPLIWSDMAHDTPALKTLIESLAKQNKTKISPKEWKIIKKIAYKNTLKKELIKFAKNFCKISLFYAIIYKTFVLKF